MQRRNEAFRPLIIFKACGNLSLILQLQDQRSIQAPKHTYYLRMMASNFFDPIPFNPADASSKRDRLASFGPDEAINILDAVQDIIVSGDLSCDDIASDDFLFGFGSSDSSNFEETEGVSLPSLLDASMENLHRLSSLPKIDQQPQACSSSDDHIMMQDRRLSVVSDSSSDHGEASVETNDSARFRSYQSQGWEERFHELQQFVRQRKHCCVPHNWAENQALSQWVKVRTISSTDVHNDSSSTVKIPLLDTSIMSHIISISLP
jgi:hypothetical protein